MFCPQCGSMVSDDANFCPQCGNKFVSPNRRQEPVMEKSTSNPEKLELKSSKHFVSDVQSLTSSNSYIVVSVFLGICILLMFFNWVSFPILGTAMQTLSSYSGVHPGYSAEYSIPGIVIAFVNLSSIATSYDSSYSSMFGVAFGVLSLVFLVWLGILVTLVVTLVKTIKEKSIFESRPFSAFVALLIFVAVVLIGVFFLNSYIANYSQYTNVASSLFGSYVSTTVWLWLLGVVSVIGLLYIKFGQK